MLVHATEPAQAGPDGDRAPTDREDAEDWLRTERNEALLEADHWRSVAESERTGRVLQPLAALMNDLQQRLFPGGASLPDQAPRRPNLHVLAFVFQ